VSSKIRKKRYFDRTPATTNQTTNNKQQAPLVIFYNKNH